jgi:hypothetical protein
VVFFLSIVAPWNVVSKAGYQGAWALILFVPLVGIIMACVFTFSNWPVLRELRAATERLGAPLPSEALRRG